MSRRAEEGRGGGWQPCWRGVATGEDGDGNVYVDFFGGAGVMAVGHANPDVSAAAERQLRDLTHALDFPTPARRDLVQALHSVLPPALSRVFFGGPTGSDAVEAAVKLAKRNTGRIPHIAFEGPYHGMTRVALSRNRGRSYKERQLTVRPEAHAVRCDACHRRPLGTTTATILDQSGTGLLKFTAANTATGAGVKTWTLQGSTTGTGEISGAIVEN